MMEFLIIHSGDVNWKEDGVKFEEALTLEEGSLGNTPSL